MIVSDGPFPLPKNIHDLEMLKPLTNAAKTKIHTETRFLVSMSCVLASTITLVTIQCKKTSKNNPMSLNMLITRRFMEGVTIMHAATLNLILESR